MANEWWDIPHLRENPFRDEIIFHPTQDNSERLSATDLNRRLPRKTSKSTGTLAPQSINSRGKHDGVTLIES